MATTIKVKIHGNDYEINSTWEMNHDQMIKILEAITKQQIALENNLIKK